MQPRKLAIADPAEFVFGVAPNPVRTSKGLVFGGGEVIPEINFTLPTMDISESTWPAVRSQYASMIEGVCQRAVQLNATSLLVEFETLPPMTTNPEWGAEITRLLADTLDRYASQSGLKYALRLTPNDTREHIRPPQMRSGQYFEGMLRLFELAGPSGADMLAIESTGGKEISDKALMECDLKGVAFALGILGCRDMEFLWGEIVRICQSSSVIPSGDTACGFGNTAMTLAEQQCIPRLFAALVRLATVPRSLVAYEMGAIGPSKDCAYEGPYMKAIAGVPISMEGRSAACAHLSPLGNISQAVCDCWSNESVQNVRLLSAYAPVVSIEHLVYDCRLLNTASRVSRDAATLLRDMLVNSDAGLDPQAHVLRPDVVIKLAEQIVQESTAYGRTRRALEAGLSELQRAFDDGEIVVPAREQRWFDILGDQIADLPKDENDLIAEYLSLETPGFLPKEYGL